MMLSPNNRGVYTDALTPPAGFELDRAIAATFSLDLTTLLSVPLQLVLQATEDRNELMRDPIALYEVLQRATERVHVFTQHGCMLAPKREHLLYSLLEPMVTEVVAPRGGTFHPKIWVLRFVSREMEQTQLRLMLASKNLTADRCWDVALMLDGALGDRENSNSKTIASFFTELPGLSVSPFDVPEPFRSLVDELRHVEWELPDGFEELNFHVLGLDETRWAPAPSRRLVVISPFIRPKALEMLAKTSEIPVAVISRSESLVELDGETPFRDAYVLHDAAETEDGEDESSQTHEIGLHAKAYMYQQGNRTYLTVGSANATDAALVARKNVEVLAELAGPSYKVGSVLKFLDEETDSGLRQYLVPWLPDDAVEVDATVKANQQALEAARDDILGGELALDCQPDSEHWVLRLSSAKPVDMSGLKSVRAWPVTVDSGKAVDASLLSPDTSVAMPVQAISSLTSLVAFRLEEGAESLSFALNLPVTGMPEERDRAILRHVVKNRQDFLRYLLMLLAGLGDGADVGSVARAFGSKSAAATQSTFDDVPLLEELVRAFSRDPKRLRKISRLIDDIRADGDADEILPKGFDKFWTIFREAMAVND